MPGIVLVSNKRLNKFLQDHRQDSGGWWKQSLMGAGGARQDIVFTEEVLFWLGSESQRGTSKWEIGEGCLGRGNGIDSSEEVGNSLVCLRNSRCPEWKKTEPKKLAWSQTVS